MKIIITSLIIGVLFDANEHYEQLEDMLYDANIANGGRHLSWEKCPNGYVFNRYGTCEPSRQPCQPGHYYALGQCEACPCNNREKSCEIDECSRVHCYCRAGYTGKYCQNHGSNQIKLDKPLQVVVEPVMQTVHRGFDEINVNCIVNDPDAQVMWLRNGQIYTDQRGQQVGRTFRIDKARDSDGGSYICLAIKGGKAFKAIASIRVIEASAPVARITPITDGKLKVPLGERVELTCNADGIRSRVSWQRTSAETGIQEIIQSSVTSEVHYQIMSMSEKQAGEYVCYAESPIGSDTKSIHVEIEPLVLKVYPEESQVVTSGQSVTLECRKPVAYPNVQVHWAREDGRPLESNAYQSPNGSLTISHIMIKDEGRYNCSATKGALSASATADIKVETLPVVKIPQSSHGEITVGIGEKKNLTCNASGHPPPNVQWQKFSEKTNSYEVVQQAMLNSVVYEHNPFSGNRKPLYRCLANSSAGSSDKIVRVVPIVPLLEVLPGQSPVVTEGSSITLECRETAGYSNFRVHWRTAKRLSLAPNVKTANGSLIITNITSNQAREYRCVGSNGAISDTKLVKIEVYTLPLVRIPQSTDGNITAKLGDKVKLRCNADGHPQPDVQWQKFSNKTHSYEAVQKATPKSSVYEFTALSENEAGLYLCLAKNSAGSSNETAQVVIKPPVVKIHSNVSRAVMSGSSVILECRESVGYSNMKIDWARDDNKTFGPNVIKLANGSLRITNIGISEEARYKCSAKNEVTSASATTEIEVKTLPVVGIPRSTDGNITAKLGDKVKLTCNAHGHPQPDVQWQKFSNKTHSYEAVQKATPKSSVYEFTALSENEAGLYLCLAKNSAGSSNKTAQVVIKPPVVKIHSNVSRAVMSGSSVILECRETVGYSDMKIDWARDDNKTFGPNVIKLANGSLRITNIGISEEARYKCSAKNEVTSASATTEIEVKTLPVVGIPRSTDGNMTAKLGDKVKLTCNADGHPQPDVQWQKFSNKTHSYEAVQKATPKSSVYEFTALSENEAGLYLCLAKNSAGSSNKTAQVVIKPPVVKIHSNVSRAVMSGSSVILECRETVGYSDMKIDWARDDNKTFGPNVIKLANGSLRITNIGISEEARYKCSAKNEVTSASATTEIEVKTLPVVGIPRSTDGNMTAKLGDKVKLTCNADGHPQPDVQWQKFSNITHTYEAVQKATPKSSVYEFTALSENEAGLYLCLAKNSAGSSNKTAQVVIKPPVVKIHSNVSRAVMSGSSVILDCRESVGYSNMKIDWARDDNKTFGPNVVKLANGSLTITRITIDYKGIYKCSVTIGGVSVSATKEIDVQLPPETEIPSSTVRNTIPPPKTLSEEFIPLSESGNEFHLHETIKVSQKEQQITVDDESEIVCEFESLVEQSTLHLTWQRAGGLPIPENFVVNDGVLKIYSPTKADSGEYICVALNLEGTVLFNASATVKVIAPPEIYLDLPREFVIGTKVTLTCGDYRDAESTYSWTVSDRSFVSNEEALGNVLTIHGLKKENKGEFCCKSQNTDGSDIACRTVEPKPSGIIKLSRSDLEVAVDGSAEVDCSVVDEDGQKINLHWERSDDSSSSNVITQKNGHLTLSKVTKMDSGDYICRGFDATGNELERKTLTLRVTAPPETIEITTKDFPDNNDVTMTCEATGDDLWYEWTAKGGEMLPNERDIWDSTLHINGVNKANDRTFCCKAFNGVGQIEKCQQLPTLLIISKPGSKVLTGSPFEIDCQVLGSDASKIHLHWQKAHDAKFSEKTITNAGLLKISNVTKTDAGDYNCVGLGDDGTEYVRKTASLNVLSEPTVVFNSDETNFKVGGTLSATCTATGDEPITLKLETDDKVLLANEKIEGPVLTVSDIPKNYERKYWCTATNAIGTSRAYLAPRIKKVEKK